MLAVYDISKVRYPMEKGLDGNLSEIVDDWTLNGEILRVYFKSDFSGTVTIEYGVEKMTVNISSGKLDSLEYVEVRLPIYALAEGAKITLKVEISGEDSVNEENFSYRLPGER